MPTLNDAPRFPGWITMLEAAEMLGMSKQAVHKKASNGEFESLHKLGAGYVLSEVEVLSVSMRPRRSTRLQLVEGNEEEAKSEPRVLTDEEALAR